MCECEGGECEDGECEGGEQDDKQCVTSEIQIRQK